MDTILGIDTNQLTLADFDNCALIEHPQLTNRRQFVVSHYRCGTGIWSATLGKPILPIDLNNNHLKFAAIKPSMSTPRIFWISENEAHRKTLYMAESETECAQEVTIPQAHKFGSLLSGNIVLLTCDQMTSPHKHWLYSIDTKGSIPLEVNGTANLDTIYALKNGNNILLIFRPVDVNKELTSAGTFFIDNVRFTVERVKKGF